MRRIMNPHFLGGARIVRGHSQQRFAGDAAVYANGEVRLTLKHFSIEARVLDAGLPEQATTIHRSDK